MGPGVGQQLPWGSDIELRLIGWLEVNEVFPAKVMVRIRNQQGVGWSKAIAGQHGCSTVNEEMDNDVMVKKGAASPEILWNKLIWTDSPIPQKRYKCLMFNKSGFNLKFQYYLAAWFSAQGWYRSHLASPPCHCPFIVPPSGRVS